VRQRARPDMRGGTLRLAGAVAGVFPPHETTLEGGRGNYRNKRCRCRAFRVRLGRKLDGNDRSPVSDMFDVEQFGELRVAVQLGGGTGQLDIHLHRTERVEGISIFAYVHYRYYHARRGKRGGAVVGYTNGVAGKAS